MNTTSCGIIQDLLPLYADGSLSKESAELVEAHIAGCDECKALLEQMQKETNIEVPTAKVTAPVNRIKKQAFGVGAIIFGGILAIALCAFLAISIKYAWPVMRGFAPMRAEDLTITTEGDKVVITPKESDFGYHIYYVYRVNDDESFSMFMTYGDIKTQYTNASRIPSRYGGAKTAYIWSPVNAEITFGEKDGGRFLETGFSGGGLTEEGYAGGDWSFSYPTRITLNGKIRDIYYLSELSEKKCMELTSVMHEYWRGVSPRYSAAEDDYPNGTYYELIPTDGFDFDSLGEAKLIWSAE
ncbi:MAG: zf-HC2 domain-containing protein [Clostridia bacterium]|nr:zf-HC2 domain-containing protein [Clostridia bacterium]